ncbi:transmembrane anchor protein [Maricaulis sp.]|uniref:transmembrane anchor protein n=1 Tax=Maricaulis sp. TaxID=1486257 RepID=UPI003298AF01
MFNSQLPPRDDLPSSESLLKATAIALLAAIVILVTIVLPAEYGVDPTRIGRVLGLTEMGEIKMQLAAEAEADRQGETAAVAARAPASETAAAAPDEADPTDTPSEAAEASPIEETAAATDTNEPVAAQWRDTISITLQPGEATEVKLTMSAGEIAVYEWTTDRAGLNSDLHGDNPQDAFISYRQGRNEPGDSGEFTAEFDGAHGWFWRNRSDVTVRVTLRARGAYSEFNRLF